MEIGKDSVTGPSLSKFKPFGLAAWPLLPKGLRPRTWALIGLLVLSLPLYGFMRVLLDRPTRLPLLMLASTYEPPWDINPWSAENADALQSLHLRNATVTHLPSPSLLAIGRWSELEDAVARSLVGLNRSQPLVLYVNLYGAVDSHKRPCLLVPGSTPLDERTWLPLASLLEHASRPLEDDRALVVFLESGRGGSLLPLPPDSPTFAEAVESILESEKSSAITENVTVVLSTASNSRSMDTHDGGPDLFTRNLADGLSGRCDQIRHGGNGNHRVELPELLAYLRQQTHDVSLSHRGFGQFVAHYQRGACAVPLAWTTRLSETSQWPRKTPQVSRTDGREADSAEDVAYIVAAWEALDRLSSLKPWIKLPHRWSRLQRTIVALEVAAFGGSSARQHAEELHQSAMHQAKSIESSLAPSDETSAGDLDTRLNEQALAGWKAVRENPTFQSASAVVQPWIQSKDHPSTLALPMLWHAVSQPQLQIWQDAERLQRLAEIQQRIAQLRRATRDLPSFGFLRSPSLQIESERRWLEDRVMCDSIDATWDQHSEELLRKISALETTAQLLTRLIESQQRALSELPALAEPVDAITALPSGTDDLGTRYASQLEISYTNLVHIGNAIGEDAVERSIVDVSHEQALLRQSLVEQWKRLLDSGNQTVPSQDRALSALLSSGLFPREVGSIEKAVELRLATYKHLAVVARTAKATNPLRMKRADGGSSHAAEPPASLPPRTAELALANLFRRLLDPDSMGMDAARLANRPLHDLVHSTIESFINVDIEKASSKTFATVALARIALARGVDDGSGDIIEAWWQQLRHQRLVSASYRIMDDFWRSPTRESECYFAVTARRLLDEASQNTSQRTVLSASIVEAQARLSSRIHAASSGLIVQAECEPQWRDDAPVQSRCRVLPGPAIEGLPAGLANLHIVDGHSVVSSIEAIAVDAKLQSRLATLTTRPGAFESRNPKQFVTTVGRDADPDDRQLACLSFRGHDFVSAFDVHPPMRHTSIGRRDLAGPTTISVQESLPQVRSRMLILDCSASMHASQSIEKPSTESATTKLELARLAIESIMQRWRNGPDSIGVMLYGHRVAVGTPEQGTLYQSRYRARFPFPLSIAAHEDVETILPLGRFSDAEFSRVKERLEALVPWGQTPLYLSVMRAVQELSRLPDIGQSSSQRDVIVISDGRNYQFNPTIESNVGLEHVIGLARDSAVRVHVIGFGVPAAEVDEATRQYQRLAQETGGTATMQVADSLRLIENLESIVRPETFTVRLPKGLSMEGVCGLPLSLPEIQRENTPVQLIYRDQQQWIPVSQGAAIKLIATADQRLVPLKFQPGSPSTLATVLNSDGSTTPFQIATFPPTATTAGWRWHLALRRQDDLIAQRPAFHWIEIVPKAPKAIPPNDREGYVIADGMWMSATPEPVLEFDTQEWPREATTAELNYWCTDRPPNAIAQWNLANLLNPSPTENLDPALSALGMACQGQVESDGFTLVLLHGPSGIQATGAMLQVFGLPSGTQIERRYSDAQRMSIHRFRFPAAEPQWDARSMTVSLYDCDQFKRAALHLASPVTIEFQPALATLPSTASPVFSGSSLR